MPSPFIFGPAKQPDSGTDSPPLSNSVANTTDLIYAGSLVIYTAGILRLVTGNPPLGTIVGVAASDNNTAPGLNMANMATPPVPAGFVQNIVPFYPASTDTLYRGHLVNGSDVYVTPVQADIGVVAGYGFRTNTNGETVIDKSTAGRFLVTRIDTEFNNKYVEGRFLAAAITQ